MSHGAHEGYVIASDNQGKMTWVNPESYINPSYQIGHNPSLGGYVFKTSSNGNHGLVVAMQDQDDNTINWYNSKDMINDPYNHDNDGKKHYDWRLPTIHELELIYNAQINDINININDFYWSNTEVNYNTVNTINFFNGDTQSNPKSNNYKIRAVRSF
jgi:hypothetical protein